MAILNITAFIGKNVQFQKHKNTLYLHFQKWQKINFCNRKKTEIFIFVSFKLYSSVKIDFLPFLNLQKMCFCTFDIALFF